MGELLEKIPPEKRWAIAAKTLWRFWVLRGDKIFAPSLARGEGIIAPVLGREKWIEINQMMIREGGRRFYPMVKEMFNIPVDDAVGAAKLYIVAAILFTGPEFQFEIIEATRERAVIRITKCPLWDEYEEFEVIPEVRVGDDGHQSWVEVGFNTVNHKLTHRFTKAREKGDTYCEAVIEFTED
jgi:hypothetical protein